MLESNEKALLNHFINDYIRIAAYFFYKKIKR